MKKLSPGELIAKSTPFVFALNSNERGIRCDFCFKSSNYDDRVTLKRCSLCKISFFCDIVCQRLAWRAFHKMECSSLSAISDEEIPTETFIFFSRLALKVLGNRSCCSTKEEVCNVNRSFDDLEDHISEIKSDSKRLEQFSLLNRFFNEMYPNLTYDSRDLLSLFGKMVVNTYTICDSEEQAIGTGLYLGASIFNHSCYPNAVAVFEGTTLYVRAIKDIDYKSHTDILISYVDPLDSMKDRQNSLKEQYYFTCNCTNCINEGLDRQKTEIIDTEKSSQIINDTQVLLKEIMPNRVIMDPDEKEQSLNKCKEQVQLHDGVLGRGHVLHIRLLDLIFDLCIDLALWDDALTFALPTVEYYKQYYNMFYPNTGIQLYRIGKIQHLLGQLSNARLSFLEAKALISVCHGSDHRMIKELENLLDQCQLELSDLNTSPSKLSLTY